MTASVYQARNQLPPVGIILAINKWRVQVITYFTKIKVRQMLREVTTRITLTRLQIIPCYIGRRAE